MKYAEKYMGLKEVLNEGGWKVTLEVQSYENQTYCIKITNNAISFISPTYPHVGEYTNAVYISCEGDSYTSIPQKTFNNIIHILSNYDSIISDCIETYLKCNGV